MWKFLEPLGQSMDYLGTLGHKLHNKLCFGVYEAGIGHCYLFQKVEPMLDEWGCPRTAHCSVSGLLKVVPGLYDLDQKRPCVVCMKLFELNGSCCVEINRLMHKLDVLI